MRNWENKVIAFAMVLMTGIMAVTMFATLSIKNKISNQAVSNAGSVKGIDVLINEIRHEKDSLRNTDTLSNDDAARYLQDRYRKP